MTRVLEPGLKILMWLSMGKKYTNDILFKGIYVMQLNSYVISMNYDNPTKKNLTATYTKFPILPLEI